MFWIDEMATRNVVLILTTAIVQQKTRDFYAKYSGKTEFVFKARNGWFDWLKKRSSLHNVKFTGKRLQQIHPQLIHFDH